MRDDDLDPAVMLPMDDAACADGARVAKARHPDALRATDARELGAATAHAQPSDGWEAEAARRAAEEPDGRPRGSWGVEDGPGARQPEPRPAARQAAAGAELDDRVGDEAGHHTLSHGGHCTPGRWARNQRGAIEWCESATPGDGGPIEVDHLADARAEVEARGSIGGGRRHRVAARAIVGEGADRLGQPRGSLLTRTGGDEDPSMPGRTASRTPGPSSPTTGSPAASASATTRPCVSVWGRRRTGRRREGGRAPRPAAACRRTTPRPARSGRRPARGARRRSRRRPRPPAAPRAPPRPRRAARRPTSRGQDDRAWRRRSRLAAIPPPPAGRRPRAPSIAATSIPVGIVTTLVRLPGPSRARISAARSLPGAMTASQLFQNAASQRSRMPPAPDAAPGSGGSPGSACLCEHRGTPRRRATLAADQNCAEWRLDVDDMRREGDRGACGCRAAAPCGTRHPPCVGGGQLDPRAARPMAGAGPCTVARGAGPRVAGAGARNICRGGPPGRAPARRSRRSRPTRRAARSRPRVTCCSGAALTARAARACERGRLVAWHRRADGVDLGARAGAPARSGSLTRGTNSSAIVTAGAQQPAADHRGG